jgi:multidrug efflux system outer membrane protein
MNRYVIWATTLALAGCSFTPAYQRPQLPVPSQWPSYEKVGAGETVTRDILSATNLQLPSWRTFFNEPRLQSLIEKALEHNRDMRIAVARVAEAQAQFGIVQADRLPTINIVAGQSAARTPAQLSPTLRAQTNRRYDINVGMTAFELDFWGRVKNLDAAARANYLATTEARDAFRLSLIADVANAYYSLQEFDERRHLAKAAADSRAESLRLINKRREVGLANDLEFLTADAANVSARAELANLERNYRLANNALALIVGVPPQNLPPNRLLADQGAVDELTVTLPSEVLLRRPDVHSAEQRLIAANANIGAARAAFLPRIGISLALGTASRTFSGLFDSETGSWSFLPSLVQPLFDSGRTQANVNLTEARKVIAIAEYEKTIQQAFREVADALAARDQLGEQLSALIANEKSQTDRLRLVDARYRAGVSSYLELLDAQRDAFTAQQSAIQVRSAMLTAAARLYKALGGDAPVDEIGRRKNS